MKPKFMVDENLGRQLADGMNAFGEDVIHIFDEFPPGTPDTEWLKYAGDNNIFVITKDRSVRRNPAELEAIRKNNVGIFFIVGKNLSMCDIIQRVVCHWHRIKELANKKKRPFVVTIPSRKGTKFEIIPV